MRTFNSLHQLFAQKAELNVEVPLHGIHRVMMRCVTIEDRKIGSYRGEQLVMRRSDGNRLDRRMVVIVPWAVCAELARRIICLRQLRNVGLITLGRSEGGHGRSQLELHHDAALPFDDRAQSLDVLSDMLQQEITTVGGNRGDRILEAWAG